MNPDLDWHPGPLRTHFQRSTLRGLTKFVGRERELAAMAAALEQARAGHEQIVAAVGEAGAGKSRLMYEFDGARLIPDATYCLLQPWSKSEKGKSRGTSVFCIVGSVP